MNLGTETSTRTPWLIGGAMALVAAAAASVLGELIGLLFFLLPGNNFQPGNAVDFLKLILEGSWPYFLAQALVALAAFAYLRKAYQEETSLAWGAVASKALILIVPAIFLMTLIIYVINVFRDSASAIGFFV